MAFRWDDIPNPLRWLLLAVGSLLARVGVIDIHRAERATDLAWPRIVTGLARMSKSAADVAMVGLALGPAAIAGVGLASPYWGIGFAFGGGIAGATISLVSQRYSGGTNEGLSLAVTTSGLIVLAMAIPLTLLYWTIPERLIALVGAEGDAIAYGAAYLQVVAIGLPFAALNLVCSRTLVGADDAWTPMILRSGGAVVNIGLNAVLIFGLEMGVVGAAIGTVVANVLILAAFGIGLTLGRLPLIGTFPVTLTFGAPHATLEEIRNVLSIGTPLAFTNIARRAAQFPLLAIIALFGSNVLAAYVIALRVRGLMNTPGWGFSLASSSLVGQELGTGDEGAADTYGREVMWFGTAVYAISAAIVLVFAEQVGRVFVDDPSILPLVTTFIVVACISVVFRGISSGATGPLRASGDTNWPFYGQLLGLYVFAIPVTALGAIAEPVTAIDAALPFGSIPGPLYAIETITPLGIGALYAAMILETLVPAAVTYYRFEAGHWKAISRSYRPESSPGD